MSEEFNDDFFNIGYGDIERAAEEARKRREKNQNNLRPFWIKSGEKDVFVRILTDKPITMERHKAWYNGRWDSFTCLGNNCPFCDANIPKQTFGAHLLIDRRSFTTREGNTYKDELKYLCLVASHIEALKTDVENTPEKKIKREWKMERVGENKKTTYRLYPQETNPIPDEDKERYKKVLGRFVDGWKAYLSKKGIEPKVFPLERYAVAKALYPMDLEEAQVIVNEIERTSKKKSEDGGGGASNPSSPNKGNDDAPSGVDDADISF